MKMFMKLMPAFGVSTQTLQGYFDLQGFWQRLTRIFGFKFPFEGKILNDIKNGNEKLSLFSFICNLQTMTN